MPRKEILIIEDDDDARTMYGIMLRSLGYDVAEATSGSEGVKRARGRVPDLIILDVMMPDLDGFEVCRELRSDPAFHRVPIIFLTALDAIDDRVKGYTTGGDDFITKGQVEYRELGVRIKAALNRTARLTNASGALGKGMVIGLLALRGGVGVSSIAMNLARYATTASDRSVILLDLAFPVGSISLWSGIDTPRHTVALLSRAPSEIDRAMIASYSLQNVYGSYFIPGPATLTDLSGIRLEALERVLGLLREGGYIVILDLGRATLPLMWRTLTHCDWTAIVTSGDSTSRSLARVSLQTLADRDVDPRSLLLLFNDNTNRKPADISLGLPRTPDVFIPYTEAFGDLVDPSPFAHLWGIVAADERTTA